jgi:hypothetical protein
VLLSPVLADNPSGSTVADLYKNFSGSIQSPQRPLTLSSIV